MSLSFDTLTPLAYFTALVQSDDHFPLLEAATSLAQDEARYSAMLDWGLRLVLLLAVPCAVALLLFSQPLVAVLFHNGAFTGVDVQRTTQALAH